MQRGQLGLGVRERRALAEEGPGGEPGEEHHRGDDDRPEEHQPRPAGRPGGAAPYQMHETYQTHETYETYGPTSVRARAHAGAVLWRR